MLPEFIIIGAMKSGTSSLYHYLSSHPDLVPAAVKETDFFKTETDFGKGVDWYSRLFSGRGTHGFEVSPNYTKRQIFPGVPNRMHAVIPKVKLIYVLRDPIQRVVSHYVHNFANGRESRSFSHTIEDVHSNYILTSRYYFQLQAFRKYFSDDQIYLVQSEALAREPAFVVAEICNFLDMPNKCDADVFQHRWNPSAVKRRATGLERALKRKTQSPYPTAIIRWLTSLLRKPVEKPELSASDRERLCSALSDDVERLRRYSGLDFDGWSI